MAIKNPRSFKEIYTYAMQHKGASRAKVMKEVQQAYLRPEKRKQEEAEQTTPPTPKQKPKQKQATKGK